MSALFKTTQPVIIRFGRGIFTPDKLSGKHEAVFALPSDHPDIVALQALAKAEAEKMYGGGFAFEFPGLKKSPNDENEFWLRAKSKFPPVLSFYKEGQLVIVPATPENSPKYREFWNGAKALVAVSLVPYKMVGRIGVTTYLKEIHSVQAAVREEKTVVSMFA